MRDLLVIGAIAGIAIIIGVTLYVFGPASLRSDVGLAVQSAQTDSSPSVSFTILEQGSQAVSVTDRTNYRIQNNDDYTALWSLVYSNATYPKMPAVDFSKYEVLALFDGSHSSTGYSISVQGISDANAVRTVMIEHATPDASCKTTTRPTSPFILIEVPKTVFTLSHTDVMQVSPCN